MNSNLVFPNTLLHFYLHINTIFIINYYVGCLPMTSLFYKNDLAANGTNVVLKYLDLATKSQHFIY